MSQQLFVIVVGTDPSSRRGGIGFALGGYLRALDFAGIEWVAIPTYHPSSPGGKWKLWLLSFPKLWRNIREIQGNGSRSIVYSHAGAGVSLLREFLVLSFCRALGAITILQLHALEVDGYLAHPVKRSIFRLAISPSVAMVVLTPWWQRRLSISGINKPLFVLPNPLPEQWEILALKSRKKKTGEGKIVLFTLSRLVPGKGVDLAIEAMAHLPYIFELIVAGDGPLRENLETRVAELGITHRVQFAGWVTGDTKQQLFDKSDIFVLPTTYDSFGMGFLEAMANGLPVVAAEWGAIPDVVPNGRCGILVRDPSPQTLADAILRLRDAETRQRMGNEAQKWVLEQFAPCKVGEEIRVMLDAITG